MAACYFINKLLAVRTLSMQNKFEGLFMNQSGCQSFFKRIDQYLKTYSDKIKKGLLREHLANIKYTDEISSKAYYVDKNLEKQIIELFMFLCKDGNTFMQNYMRKQTNNSRSFNIVIDINEFAKVFKSHLHYSVSFDTFLSCLKWLFEFIQGPNKKNQNVLILNDFVNMANGILIMKYHDKDKAIEKQYVYDPYLAAELKSSSKVVPKSSFRRSSARDRNATMGYLFSKQFSEIMHFSKPASNYMISLSKYQTLMLLNTLIDGFEPTDYVYYLYRREIDPSAFRLNFAYQQYFLKKFHKSEYKTDLFFQYHVNINKNKRSPFLIEIGFLLYFLIKKMEKNLKMDEDDRYNNQILKLLPTDEQANDSNSKSVVSQTINFITSFILIFVKCCTKKLSVIEDQSIEHIQHNDTELGKIFIFYEKYSSRIEIMKENKLHEYYFSKLPYCDFRNKEQKTEFMDNVNRTNCKTKCEDLARNSKLLTIVLKLDYRLRYSCGSIIGLIVDNIELWRNYLTLLALVLNIIIILSYNNELNDRNGKPNIGKLEDYWTLFIIYLLGSISFVFVIIICFTKLFIRVPYNYKMFYLIKENTASRVSTSIMTLNVPGFKLFKDFCVNVYDIWYMMLTDLVIVYHLMLSFLTILGFALHPFFFAFLLTYVISRSNILLKVLRAVYEPKKEILWTLSLLIMATYFFTILSYTAFHEDYDGLFPGSCYSLWSCLLVTLDATYKFDGAIGGFLGQPFDESQTKEVDVRWGRFVFDYLFNIIIALLILEILSGIIIDKFSELREQLEEKDKDCKSE